ncbi:MAG: sugar ABC transporter ATP-binding protein [Gammaproteobacteria bacterium]|nr:sugar ABC transporter ATP-binding protein [Gammaproteobacteria bacterium]MBV8306780.1 sugar ABC transporter ATP-binding protein [Gammaproteobacteria bacterium]
MEAEAAHAPDDCLLEARHISKRFPGVTALDDVSLRVSRGTVHALVGENGAGKSTLMKIIAGIVTADAGELRLNGRTLQLDSPRAALASGIAMIHQELNLLPSMSVAENIWIGREPVNAFQMIRHRELHRRTTALLARLHIDLDPGAQVGSLPVASRQMVEIARALSHESRLLIMDEPTSALGEHDAAHLFAIIRELKAQGKAVLYITHRMDELWAIADEVTVLRDGRCIGTDRPGNLTREQIIRMMVGRELARAHPYERSAPGRVLLAAEALALPPHFHDVSFELRAGEILGIAGLIGAGRSKLAEALFGVTPATSGHILIDGRRIEVDSPGTALARGLAFLTEDRKETGCFLTLDVLDNLEMAVLTRDFVRFGFVRGGAVSGACADISERLRVKTRGLREPIAHLSGGNQQKVLLGRWLLTGPRVLILDEPTRGIDVAAKAEIHNLIGQLAAQGAAVLMISSELPEILGMSHRIMVMRGGRVTGMLERTEADPERVMTLAAG